MEHETFWTLLTDRAHWEFELFLMFLFDILLGLIIWPFLRSFFIHHKSDDDKIAKLEAEVAQLKQVLSVEVAPTGFQTGDNTFK